MADSKTKAENIQDEPSLWHQKPRKEKMNIEMCAKDSDANWRGSHTPKMGPFEYQ